MRVPDAQTGSGEAVFLEQGRGERGEGGGDPADLEPRDQVGGFYHLRSGNTGGN